MGNKHDLKKINKVMDDEVAESTTVATLEELRNKTNVNDVTAYIKADPFTGNPFQLLGQVIEIRKSDGMCPTSLLQGRDLKYEFSPIPVTGFKIDEETKLSKPVLRGSVIVDKKLSAQAGFLNFLSVELDDKSSFSLMIMDQVKGLVDFHDTSWKEAIKEWMNENQAKMDDPDICFIYVVTGFIQKNILKKRYDEFSMGTKGGAYGLNIEGKLYTSNQDYSLDIIFGLTPAVIKRPLSEQKPVTLVKGLIPESDMEANEDECKLFALTTGAVLEENYTEMKKVNKLKREEILQE